MPPNANLTWDPKVRNELKVVFQITNDKQADELAQAFARAGAIEALDLATGRITVTSMADARSHRIMCLLKSGIPVPRCKEVVSSLFGVIPAVAQRYVDTALARHRSELSPSVDAALIAAFTQSPPYLEGYWLVNVPDELVARLKELARQANQPDPVSARQGSIWKIPSETHETISKRLGLVPLKVP